MNTLTYQDYINYLSYYFNKYDPSKFKSDEDLKYYHLLNERLERSKSLPASVLNSPILGNVNLDKDTLRAISEMKSLANSNSSKNNRFTNLIDRIRREFVFEIDSNKLIGAAISLLIVTILSLVAFLSPETSGLPLSGSAGSGSETTSISSNPLLTVNIGIGSALLALFVLMFAFITNRKR